MSIAGISDYDIWRAMQVKLGNLSGREIDLDVIRGTAILLALGWHFNYYTGLFFFDMALYPGRSFGWAGVDLFFVLSGFLIGRLIFEEISKNNSFNYRRFFLRRAFRLWPTLYAFLLVQLISGRHDWRSYLLQNAFHLQNFLGSSLNHLWSLAVEEQFYLLFGVSAFLWAGRITKTPQTPLILFAVLCASPLLRFFASYAGWSEYAIQQQTEFRLDVLVSGVLMAFIFVFHPNIFARMLNLKWLWLFVTLAGCVFLANFEHATPGGEAIVYTVAWISSAAFVLLIYKSNIETKLPSLSRILAFLGVYSYSLYIWQFAGVSITAFIQKHCVYLGGVAWEVALKYVSAIAVGFLVSKSIERPMMELRDRLFAKSGAAGQTGESDKPLVISSP